jgi:hypothetical protein
MADLTVRRHVQTCMEGTDHAAKSRLDFVYHTLQVGYPAWAVLCRCAFRALMDEIT